ncbi:uncharacterized protein LOC134943527 isoform X2 [Pseudophryne corroboree]
MDTLEQLLPEDEENLFSCSMTELEKIVQVFSDQVQAHREQLNKTKAELHDLETETTERHLSRELHVSLIPQALDLQEALEEEAETQQQLQAVTVEMERLTETPPTNCSEALETRLKQVEDLTATYSNMEKDLLEETENLKIFLQQSHAGLAQVTSDHQRVEEELLTLQNRHLAQKCPLHSEAKLLLDTCIKEIESLNALPEEKRRKK